MELLQLLSTLLLISFANSESIYPKSSAVLQVDARTYPKLIEKSNYTSIIEFYAPWCGHCKNLAPAYEKAAQSLSGFANVAAINCDDDSNKAFCGQMGVQGFPTLKLVKPKRKGGKPIVEDYNGERSAKAIKETVLDKMPNHVQKVADEGLDMWMTKNIEKPKLVFFSEKAVVSPLVKSIAIDYLGIIDVAQIRSTESMATGRFMIEKYPTVMFMASGEHVPERYEGKVMNKAAILEWLKGTGVVEPNPQPSVGKATKEEKKEKKGEKKSTAKKASPIPIPDAASETLEDNSNPTESPNPNVAAESPAPIKIPIEPVTEITSLDSESALRKSCLTSKSGTCVLAILSAGVDAGKTGTGALSEIAHKHVQRKSKLFPFYSIPETNTAGQTLVSSLGIKDTATPAILLAVNAKRGWWTQYTGSDIGSQALESWVDNIRFGDFSKKTLPDGVIKEAEEEAAKEEKAPENPIKVEKVEVMDNEPDTPPHEEL